ncbi:PREDICTED: uncharacterized protein LOC109470898 [Branchiostoma belcheri]|uniref:Uncharacterized protein LOC109470898 n=1 Tax=Branchiostoma belcheri TaxID=7741 RepID=A0A6P4Z3A8_BRABE|nr:PREDICTED: uncharacterized protein LOC109470898 [Branchiostoma belcheri]
MTEMTEPLSEEDKERTCHNHFKKGSDALQEGDLESAEHHFAAGLKIFHRSSTTPLPLRLRKEVEGLQKLGDVYKERGRQGEDGRDFTKATALYNAALARSDNDLTKDALVKSIKETERHFTQTFTDHPYEPSPYELDKEHKQQLNKHRALVERELRAIDEKFDPKNYDSDDDDDKVRDFEGHRADAVRAMFVKIAEDRKQFLQTLLLECIEVLGRPTCLYAVIGLGSQATQLVTPYSDLEFAILIEEGKDSDDEKQYFRNLTNLLHMKVINLGETILPAMAIKSLNDFTSSDPEDNWFYDDITPRGMSFDGSMPWASKTPLGRDKTLYKPKVELIDTPANLAKYQQEEISLAQGYNLARILRNVTLLHGDQRLVEEYQNAMETIFAQFTHSSTENVSLAIKQGQVQLRQDIGKFGEYEITERIIDVKKEMYRFPTVMIDTLALCLEIPPTNLWDTVDKMKLSQKISDDNAHHLRVLLSISAELRLRTYMTNKGQKESMSALTQALYRESDDDEFSVVRLVFPCDWRQLLRYQYTAVPLKKLLSKLTDENVSSYTDHLLTTSLCQRSLDAKVDACMALSLNQLAVSHLEKYIEQMKAAEGSSPTDLALALGNLGSAWSGLAEYETAVKYYEQALETFGQDRDSTDTARLLNNLGVTWERLGHHQTALGYHERALVMLRSLFGQESNHLDIARCLSHIGTAWYRSGNNQVAITYSKQSLNMIAALYGDNTGYDDIMIQPLETLGSAWYLEHDYKKAQGYFERALEICQTLFGRFSNNPDTATCLSNLASVSGVLGQHEKAIKYYQQALEMQRAIYGPDAAHDDIATMVYNIGMEFRSVHQYQAAIVYFEQALEMDRTIFGQNAGSKRLASLLSMIATTWNDLSATETAISYHEKALQMERTLHGQGANHADIVSSLTNLALLWNKQADYKKAVSYFEEVLAMQKALSKDESGEKAIATTLHNLGTICHDDGQYHNAIRYLKESIEKQQIVYGPTHTITTMSLRTLARAYNDLGLRDSAVNHYEQALEMKRVLYGQNCNHADIVSSLTDLGSTQNAMGHYETAISYYEQALEMQKDLYGESAVREDIATSLDMLGLAHFNFGQYEIAIKYFDEALTMYKALHGEDAHVVDIATTLSNLGISWHYLEHHEIAIWRSQQGLDMLKQMYGQDATSKVDVGRIYNNIGMSWYCLGHTKAAISFFEQALEIYGVVYGTATNHPDIAVVLNGLGVAWHRLKDEGKGITHLHQALEMYRTFYGIKESNHRIALTLNNLGLAYNAFGKYDQAMEYAKSSLEMQRSLYGQNVNRKSIVVSLRNLGDTSNALGDHKAALDFYKDALEVQKAIHEPDRNHFSIATTLHDIGKVFCRLEDYQRAVEYFQQSLEMSRELSGGDEEDPDVVVATTSLQEASDLLKKSKPDSNVNS